MKLIVYYLVLLIFIALFAGFLLAHTKDDGMSMGQTVSASALLVLYTVAVSVLSEGGRGDERETLHRHLSNRAGMLAGTAVFSIGILYQLFTHNLDWWLLAGLIVINLTKIISLIYLNYRQ